MRLKFSIRPAALLALALAGTIPPALPAESLEGRSSTPPIRQERSPVYSILTAPEGGGVITSAYRKGVQLWGVGADGNFHLRRTLVPFDEGHPTVFARLSPDGRTLATWGFGSDVYLWDRRTGARTGRFREFRGSAVGVAFSPDGKEVAVGTGQSPVITRLGKPVPGFGEVVIWDPSAGKVRRRLGGFEEAVGVLAYAPNGHTLAVANRGKVLLYDARTGERKRELSGGPGSVHALALSPDGRRIAAGGMELGREEEGALALWDAATGERLCRWESKDRRVSSLAYSPDGSTLASGGQDGSLKLWTFHRQGGMREEWFPRLAHTLTGHQNEVVTLSYFPNGRRLASGSVDGMVGLWDTKTARLVVGLTIRP